MTATCVDLRERFGSRFRIGRDPAAGPKSVDPWMWTIPCSRGTIYPDGAEFLRVDIDGRPVTAKAVGALPGVELVQDGEADRTFRFHADRIEDVARLVRPYRRRVLSDEQRDRLREMGAAHRFPARRPALDASATS